MDADLMTLPKAELHLHIEGTLEPALALELADRNGVDLGFSSVDELRAAYRFKDLPDFLSLYYRCMQVLRTEADFHDLTAADLSRAAAQGVAHAEIFFDAQAHLKRGVPLAAIRSGMAAALTEAGTRHGITGGLILSFLRDEPVAEAAEAWRQARSQLNGVIAVGLDSAELGFPPAPFSDLFAQARAVGLRTVAHAGEEGPPEYIVDALDLLKVDRIDHGIRSLEDPELTGRVAAEQVPLTVCPLSNVALRCVPDLDAHPLLRMLEAGLLVTVNSDDPAFFGGYVADNFQALSAAGMSTAEAVQLARNSVVASFAPTARKRELQSDIDRWVQLHQPTPRVLDRSLDLQAPPT